MRTEAKVIHVGSWEEFKDLATTLHPDSVFYTIQRSPLSKPPVGLRIVFASSDAQYIFLDFARGETLQKTKLPISINETGESYVGEEEIKQFIKTQLGRVDLPIYSFEILGF